MSKRASQILEILTQEHKVEVALLAEGLGVSSVTMRKDLDELQSKGLVRREHGYALLANPNDVAGRLAYHYEEKLRIASKAAELVPDGATIMVENGSCCALLARRIADTREDVTIVTNSGFIADYVRDSPHVDVTLLGGSVQRDSQVMVGPLVRICAQEFLVDRLFIGADGWADGVGFTNADQMRAEAVRSMAESASEVVVLTESEKFGRRGAVPIRVKKPITVVTDADIPEEARGGITKLGIQLIIA
ncbi:DeoR/GlpR transcriptional regulator [Coriobacteriales bacterium OH1046]|nr:DeoR/GlpR transcriptional regulator [Coriobacteriales bacterium OH1046]